MFTNSLIRGLGLSLLALLCSTTSQAALNIQQWKTSQGSEVFFVENHDLPIVDVSTNFYAGSARDSKAKSGLAGITRYMMTLGAAGMTDEEIAKQMADIGANMGGSLDADRAGFKLRTLSSEREQKKALEIYTKIIQKPDFPEAVLAREKSRIIAGLKESSTQPESIASKAFAKALFGNHPYALDEAGELDTVSAIAKKDLQTFYQQHYVAQGAVIALMGDLTRAQAEKIAESISTGLPAGAQPSSLTSVAYPSAAIEERIAHPASQAHILLGYPGMKRGDSDFFPLYVGNYILGGGGFVSRLTEEVREKRGLVYSVYSYFMPTAELGQFQIGLQTKREQSDEALKLVRDTLNKFVAGGVTEAELKAAKQNLVGGFPMRIDSNAKILDYLAMIGFYKLPLNYLDTFNEQVSKVTAAQIKEAFNRRIKTEKMVTVIVAGDETN
jgi:zinc protease